MILGWPAWTKGHGLDRRFDFDDAIGFIALAKEQLTLVADNGPHTVPLVEG